MYLKSRILNLTMGAIRDKKNSPVTILTVIKEEEKKTKKKEEQRKNPKRKEEANFAPVVEPAEKSHSRSSFAFVKKARSLASTASDECFFLLSYAK